MGAKKQAGQRVAVRETPSPATKPNKSHLAAMLQESCDRLQATIEALPDLMFVVDREGRIYDYHAPDPDLLYVLPDQFMGQNLKELLPEPAAEILREAFASAVVNGHHKGGTYSLTMPDGLHWFELSIAAQGDPKTPAGRLVAIVRDVTDRKRAEDALRESEQKYRMLTEGMKDVVWVLDIELQRFLYVSPSVEKLRGYTPEEILAEPVAEAWAPEQREELYAFMQRCVAEFLEGKLNEDTYVTFEMLQPCKDGSTVPSEVVGRLMRNERTGRIEAHGVTRDITERKQAEAALRESEARFDQSAKQSRTYLWEVDADGLYIFVSHVVEDVLGYRPEEMVGKLHFYDLFPPEFREATHEEIAERMRRRSQFRDYENPCRARDGHVVWVITSAMPVLNADGSLRGYRGSDTDISERKRAEEELKRSEAKYRQLHETMRDGFAVADMNGMIMESNRAFQEMLGYSEDELCRMTYMDLTPGKWHSAEEKIVADQIISRGYSDLFEKEYVRKNGTVIPIELRSILIRDADGTPAGMWAIVRDITERKRAENALKQARDELEQRVEERTAELLASQKKLAQSQKELRALLARFEKAREEERMRIARDIHDAFGQNLTAIKMDLRQIERIAGKASSSPPWASVLERTTGAIELADTTQAMIQEIAAELRPGVLDRLGLGPALQSECRRFGERHGIQCTVAVSADLPELPPEAVTALFRIFQECLTNVARHAEASQVNVELEAAGGDILLRVRDNGAGIREETISNPASLGLIGMRERAAGLGGEAIFRRGEGCGTVVEVRIPLCAPDGGREAARENFI